MLCTVEKQNKETAWVPETSGGNIDTKPLGEDRQNTIH